MIWIFCFVGFCSLYNKGIGRIKIAKSVRTLKAAIIVAPISVLMQ